MYLLLVFSTDSWPTNAPRYAYSVLLQWKWQGYDRLPVTTFCKDRLVDLRKRFTLSNCFATGGTVLCGSAFMCIIWLYGCIVQSVWICKSISFVHPLCLSTRCTQMQNTENTSMTKIDGSQYEPVQQARCKTGSTNGCRSAFAPSVSTALKRQAISESRQQANGKRPLLADARYSVEGAWSRMRVDYVIYATEMRVYCHVLQHTHSSKVYKSSTRPLGDLSLHPFVRGRTSRVHNQ